MAWNAAMNAGDSAGAAKAEDAYTSVWGGSGVSGSQQTLNTVTPSASVTPMAASTAVYLNVTQVGQDNDYYCGPAAGYEIIQYLNGSGYTSRYDGSSLSQTNLANAHHMQTTANGTTDWATGLFVTGVNRWRGVNYYTQVHAPSASLLPNVFTYSMDANGMPFSGDTVEFAGLDHYNQHPKPKTIGHWITAWGYSSSGAIGYWADSSTTVFVGYGVMPYFSADNASFDGYLQSNGIAY